MEEIEARQKVEKNWRHVFSSGVFISISILLTLPAIADSPGRGLAAQFEKDYLIFIINHHFSALRIIELAAGTDPQRDAAIDNPQEGTSPMPEASATPAKATSDEIKSMARQANRMQREEIATAQRFLREWHGINSTSQLLPEGQRQIQLLEQTPVGDQFNHVFLEVFSSHHYRALVPSQDCLVKADIKHDSPIHYCEGIVENQAREINDMRKQLCDKFNICDFQPTTGVRGQSNVE